MTRNRRGLSTIMVTLGLVIIGIALSVLLMKVLASTSENISPETPVTLAPVSYSISFDAYNGTHAAITVTVKIKVVSAPLGTEVTHFVANLKLPDTRVIKASSFVGTIPLKPNAIISLSTTTPVVELNGARPEDIKFIGGQAIVTVPNLGRLEVPIR